MSLEEKLAYVGGDREFYLRAIPRLGIPEIKMSDGPSGCRNWGPSTAYPAALAVTASFDVALSERVGRAMARDCRARGARVLLAPGVNLHRSPLAGRNFEYRGEDPFLAGKTAAAFIRGVQSEGVLATVKHFAANNQEWDRNHVSSEVDERTLRELYFPAFERAVREGGVAAVMTAYNLLNGTYCSHHDWLLKRVLKTEWGFRGFVMSDWGAVHDGRAAAVGGCDLEMPSGKHMSPATLSTLLDQSTISQAMIDDKVRRILRTLASAGLLESGTSTSALPLDDPTSAEAALEAARQSIVLLKNAGALLPLDRARRPRIAVIGPNAEPAVVGGSGSAFVTPFRAVSLLQGLRDAAPELVIQHHPGVRQSTAGGQLGKPLFSGAVRQEVFAGKELAGEPRAVSRVDRIDFRGGAPAPGMGTENFSVRWTGSVRVPKTARYDVMVETDDGVRVTVDGKRVIDDWSDHAAKLSSVTLDLRAGEHQVVVEYYQGRGGAVAAFGLSVSGQATTFQGGKDVTALARAADLVVVSVGFGQSADTNSVGRAFHPFWPPGWARSAGLVEAEDSDRPYELPPAQLETIRLAAAANRRTILIVNAGGAVDLRPFVDIVPALLWAWYPGQAGGRALAEVLLGDVNPSAKLPVTFARRYEDYPSAASYHSNQNGKTRYGEGIFVGYRGFDESGVEPAFPFGFGLSYTAFEYSGLAATASSDGSVALSLRVTNRGQRAGAEVVQLYVAPLSGTAARPPQELKGFARVALAPGETRTVSMELEPRAFAHWNERSRAWSVEAGDYELRAGASSRDIRLRQRLSLGARTLPL